MIDFSGISLPFNVSDLLSSSMGLIGIVASFVLLALAINFTPMIIHIIKTATGYYDHYSRIDDADWYEGKAPNRYEKIRMSVRKGIDYRNER
jgi:hypothetical protein